MIDAHLSRSTTLTSLRGLELSILLTLNWSRFTADKTISETPGEHAEEFGYTKTLENKTDF